MRKTLYCGVDLHSNNAMYVITDEQDKQLLRKTIAERIAGGAGDRWSPSARGSRWWRWNRPTTGTGW